MKNQKKTPPITKSVDEMSTEELSALLKEKKKQESKQRESLRTQYEKDRDEIIKTLTTKAQAASKGLAELKELAMRLLPEFRQRMLDYGSIRNGKKNKGTFEIKNELMKITFTSHVNKTFDERAEMAEQKLKDFLATTVKKRDIKLHDMILSLLSRNERTGDFDISLINRLYKMEDQFDDPNWVDAIRLFKESYSPTGTAQYVRFWVKGESGGWEAVLLDFAKIKTGK